jgi:nucleoside-diphosphate-sugar epimerase
MSKPQRRVLVTGATTALGRQLVHELYHDQANVECVLAVARDELPYYFRDFHGDRFQYRVVETTKPRQLKELFLSDAVKRLRIDSVIHIGFLRSAKAHGVDPAVAVEGSRQLLDRCLETESIQRFIFLSGSLVYKLGPYTSGTIDEFAELNFDVNADPWTRARIDADMLCRAKMDNGRLKIIVLRPSPIVGRNISSHLNDYLESYLITMIAGWDPMMRPIHSSDVRRAIHRALGSDVQGLFNIAGPDIAPLSEFARLTGRPLVTAPFPVVRRLNALQRAVGLTTCDLTSEPTWIKYSCVVDTSKIEAKLGWKAEQHIKFG